MSYRIDLPRAASLALSIALLAGAAHAQYADSSTRVFTNAQPDSVGSGLGSIHLPTASGDGLMVGVLEDQKDGTRYVLEAQLTTWMPCGFDGSTRVVFGGIYGQLREHVEPTLPVITPDPFIGRVEGIWRLERNFTGIYSATVYERVAGAERVAGNVEGRFHVSELDDAVPGPQEPPYADRSILKRAGTVLHAADQQPQAELVKRPAFTAARPLPVSDAASAPAGPVLGDAASHAEALGLEPARPQKVRRVGRGHFLDAGHLVRRLRDAASGSKSASATPWLNPKSVFQSAAAGAFHDARPDYATPPVSKRAALVWPALSGAFRASYELYD